MPYDPLAIANYFIERAAQDGVNLSPMKLQKLLYFAEGWHQAFRNEDLMEGEIAAWKYGPVIPEVYTQFRDYGNSHISEPASTIEMVNGSIDFVIPAVAEEDGFTRRLLDHVWSAYKKFTAIELSEMTHRTGTPWYQIYVEQGRNIRRNLPIPKELIRRHFEAALQRNRAARA